MRIVHALMVPALEGKPGKLHPDTIVVDGDRVFAALKETS
jgi:hypothetical protein